MKRIKSVSILVMVAILSLLIAPTACTAEDSQPDFGGCENEGCHPDVAANFTTSLHYAGAGMKGEYERGAAGHFGISNSNYAPTHSNCRDHSLKFSLSKRIASHNRIFDQTKYNPNQLIFKSDKQN